MQGVISLLAERARAPRIAPSPQLDAALAELDAELEALAAELQVEYLGPGVGVEGERGVYRLVVRAHREGFDEPRWGMKVCDALPNAGWRVAWAVQSVSRLRKEQVVRALPVFFGGYLEAVRAAGREDAPAARRLAAWAEAFGNEP